MCSLRIKLGIVPRIRDSVKVQEHNSPATASCLDDGDGIGHTLRGVQDTHVCVQMPDGLMVLTYEMAPKSHEVLYACTAHDAKGILHFQRS